MSNEEEEHDIELFVDRELVLPRPLDRHIASVTVDTHDNYLNDGFSVELSASFGKEYIILEGDGFEVEVELAIEKSEIELIAKNIDLARQEENENESSEWSFSQKKSSSKKQIGRKRIGVSSKSSLIRKGDSNANVDLEAGVSKETGNSNETKSEGTRIQKNWRFIGRRALSVGGQTEFLYGQEVDRLKAWRAVPNDHSTICGIAAVLKIRERWISFNDPTYNFKNSPTGNKIKNLFRSKNKIRRELFLLLLKHLAYKQLPKTNDDREAILAVDALIVKPGSSQPKNLDGGDPIGRIAVPTAPLFEFLELPPGQEVPRLLSSGVPKQDIEKIVGDEGVNETNDTFVPQGSPESAFAAFEELVKIYRKETITLPVLNKSILENEYGRNAIRDLTSLNISVDLTPRDRINFDIFADPEITFKNIASSTLSLMISRQAILKNSRISGIGLAEIVAGALDRDWSKGSKQRYGSELKRWAIWIEPHLVNANKNPNAYAMVAFAKGDKPKHGRRKSMATPELRLKAQSLLDEGFSLRKAAFELGITVASLKKLLNE